VTWIATHRIAWAPRNGVAVVLEVMLLPAQGIPRQWAPSRAEHDAGTLPTYVTLHEGWRFAGLLTPADAVGEVRVEEVIVPCYRYVRD
jgi:hypothetical protein